ncbi:MAG: ABC transporter ATP-binding protein [Candidatus Acidiferrales bacterium]
MDLRLENVTKRFGDRLAVEIPSLTIHGGEFFTFVGPSGCGKSTTLNLIAGLEAPSDGSLRLGDRDLTALPPHRRDVAFVFQSYALYPHRTVFGNLAFPLELARTPRPEIRRRVEEAAARLNLMPLLDKYPRQLSGGERQRVALGRAMVRQPQLFLFDEPLSNLDAPLRAQMRKELKRLQQELGATFIYVTHDQEEALSLSDRIAVMRAGRIQQCGGPREIYDRPADTFVASFFGSPPINLLDATVEPNGLHLGDLRLPLQPPPGTTRGAKLKLGIRPEHIRLHAQPAAGTWPAQVALVELHGGQSTLELEAGGLRLSAVADAAAAHQPGQTLYLELLPDRLLFFDTSTGTRFHK